MYNEELLHQVAGKCPEYESITVAQGYGISFLGNLESLTEAQCDLCVNWDDSHCDIFQEHKVKY
ncbi:hypothetical protein [Selenihalanaerobacter shriftii]|uniref:Uncharacterized protein n=1 Tax=Selenihalanaerobacter shriftii TaxID=142842 RepID=A0A1T4LWA7_9FIRM|nr:hypothetical protein [Selenihalanaerobacter shriftii]SJZ58937.1 hypothetical protein SAMN02745118_01272 [Selenihalanaerobacter shriftii]